IQQAGFEDRPGPNQSGVDVEFGQYLWQIQAQRQQVERGEEQHRSPAHRQAGEISFAARRRQGESEFLATFDRVGAAVNRSCHNGIQSAEQENPGGIGIERQYPDTGKPGRQRSEQQSAMSVRPAPEQTPDYSPASA